MANFHFMQDNMIRLQYWHNSKYIQLGCMWYTRWILVGNDSGVTKNYCFHFSTAYLLLLIFLLIFHIFFLFVCCFLSFFHFSNGSLSISNYLNCVYVYGGFQMRILFLLSYLFIYVFSCCFCLSFCRRFFRAATNTKTINTNNRHSPSTVVYFLFMHWSHSIFSIFIAFKLYAVLSIYFVNIILKCRYRLCRSSIRWIYKNNSNDNNYNDNEWWTYENT